MSYATRRRSARVSATHARANSESTISFAALSDVTNRGGVAGGHKGADKGVGRKRARAATASNGEGDVVDDGVAGDDVIVVADVANDGDDRDGARAARSARKNAATGSGRAGSEAPPTVGQGDDLECLERMPSARASTRAVPNDARGMVQTNSVEFPFSVHGGRRAQEVASENVLSPYVVNGKYFNVAMRQQLVDWMGEQHAELSLTDETLHLAIRYADTFLSQRVPDVFLQRHGSGSEPVPCAPLKPLEGKRTLYSVDALHPLCNKLKRLGITCVFVAAKVTEVTTPSAVEFARYADVASFTREQLLLAERALLRELNYSLIRPTAFSFAEAYAASAKSALTRYADRFDFESCNFAEYGTREDFLKETTYYLVELAAIAHQSLEFSPSMLGAAAVCATLRHANIAFDEVPMLREVAGYSDKELEKCVEFLKNVTRDAWMIQEYGEGLNVNVKYEGVAEFLFDACGKYVD